MNNQYPMQGIAQQLQAQGRNGDDVLVHMNPVEVQGLASLSPNGLTINPYTGQPEAFNLMESVIPMVAGLALTAASAGTLAAPVAMGLGSGVASGAMTGDWERGLATGLIGAGTGMALGAGAAGADAALTAGTDAAMTAGTDAAIQAGTDAAMTGIAEAGIEAGGIGATEALTQEALAQAAQEQTMAQALGANATEASVANLGVEAGGTGIGATEPFLGGAQQSMTDAIGTSGAGYTPDAASTMGSDFMTNFKEPWVDGGYKDVGRNLMKPQSVMPIALGANQLATMDAEEANARGAAKQEKEDNQQREDSYNRLQAAYAMAQPNAQRGVYAGRSDYGSSMPDWWKPEGYASGGTFTTSTTTSGQPAGYDPYGDNFNNAGNPYQAYTNPRMAGGIGYGSRGSGIDPLTIQAGLRGKYSVSPHQMNYTDDQYMDYGQDQYEYDPADMTYDPADYYYAEDQYDWGPDSYNKKGNLRRPNRRGEKVLIPGAKQSLREGAVGTPNEGAEMRLKANAVRQLKEGAVGTPNNYRAGFDPEFQYFQNDPDNVVVPDSFTDAQRARLYPALPDPVLQGQNGSYFDSFGQAAPPPVSPDGIVDTAIKGQDQFISPPDNDNGMAAGGEVALQTDYGPHNIPGGGVASLPSPYINETEASAPMPPMAQPQADNPRPPQAQPESGGQPSDQDIQMLALALTGQIGDKRDMVIERFINEFGTEMFREAREFILQFMAGGDAQTEGMVQGQGGGMDDQVMGTIGGQEGVAVSPGEYIVPADVVSGLGDGSSDAGAAELENMSERVRMARGGSTTQPPPFDARNVLPV